MAIFFEIISPFECGKRIFCHYTYCIGINFVAILTENVDVFKQLFKEVKVNLFCHRIWCKSSRRMQKLCFDSGEKILIMYLYIVHTMVIIMRANLLMIRWNRLGTYITAFTSLIFPCTPILHEHRKHEYKYRKNNFDRYFGTLKKTSDATSLISQIYNEYSASHFCITPFSHGTTTKYVMRSFFKNIYRFLDDTNNK